MEIWKAVLLRYVDTACWHFHDHWTKGEGVPDIGAMQDKLLATCRNEYYADSAQRIFMQVSKILQVSSHILN